MTAVIDLDPRIEPFVQQYISGSIGADERAILSMGDTVMPALVCWTNEDGSVDEITLRASYIEVTSIAQKRALVAMNRLVHNPWRKMDTYSVCDGCSEHKQIAREFIETEAWLCQECYDESLTARQALIDFHEAYGVPVRARPTTDISVQERLLRANLVFEEACEFVAAMGFGFEWDPDSETPQVESTPRREMDLIEAADALADTKYVVEGSAIQLGINLRPVFLEVHRSNMSKLGADGRPIYREGDRKVLKGPGYSPPDIERVLFASTPVESAA